MESKTIVDLATPCLVLDKNKVVNNCRVMREHVSSLGASLRPHGKTAKCIEVMRLALQGLPQAITVSTLREADYYFENGITDMIYAVGIAPVKLDHVARLNQKGAQVKILLDSLEQARIAAAHGRRLGVTFDALVEFDCDGHSGGVAPFAPLLIDIARILHQEDGVSLQGILTHAGGSYDVGTPDRIRAAAEQERQAAVLAADRLRQAGLPCPLVSIGSTPTARFTRDLTGISEIRPGVFMFHDLVQAGLGVCTLDQIALTVLASIIGHQKEKGWIIIDAGWTALSADRGTARQAIDQGYGLVCDLDGRPCPDLIVNSTTQEHGIVVHRRQEPIDYSMFPIGGKLRILPNHACATAVMHDHYVVVEGNREISGLWRRVNGW